ncbi:hypothetical protein C8Q77DRAFT_426582 [Trametes polyzona]|nr:hypothetical protein C8Q77DRAFT_426582 [Trametes polyzona]
MSADAGADAPSLDSTIGVELIGFGISLALYGITTGQAVTWFRQYAQPPMPPCIYLVSALWAVDTLHIVLVAFSVFRYLVSFRGNTAIFVRPPWTLGAIVITSEINGLLVRIGYAYRIWRLSGKRWIIPCVIATCAVLVTALGLAFAGQEVHLRLWEQGDDLEWMLYSGFSCQIATDTLIAASMFVVLRRFRTGLRRLDLVIRTIIMYVVYTGFLTILGSALCIIFFIVRRTSFIYTGLYFTLPKLCTCSFLGVMNAEQLLIRRASTGSGAHTTLPVLSTAVRLEPSASDSWIEERTNVRMVPEC